MPYKNPVLKAMCQRGAVRVTRHGDWRQTYIDCLGMCIARVNSDDFPCSAIDGLELHEMWGEGTGKFQQRVLLCNLHHSLLEDKCHQADFMLMQYRKSKLAEDVELEMMVCGGYNQWVKKYKLDDSRTGCLLDKGPKVEDYE